MEGPIRDPVLARFPKVAAFSSAESGSGEPPDRAQICAMMLMMCEAGLKLFFSEPILGPPNVDFSRENAKKSVKKVDSTRHVATNCAKSGSGTKPRQKSGSPSLESELKLSRRPSPEAQPAPRVHSSMIPEWLEQDNCAGAQRRRFLFRNRSFKRSSVRCPDKFVCTEKTGKTPNGICPGQEDRYHSGYFSVDFQGAEEKCVCAVKE